MHTLFEFEKEYYDFPDLSEEDSTNSKEFEKSTKATLLQNHFPRELCDVITAYMQKTPLQWECRMVWNSEGSDITVRPNDSTERQVGTHAEYTCDFSSVALHPHIPTLLADHWFPPLVSATENTNNDQKESKGTGYPSIRNTIAMSFFTSHSLQRYPHARISLSGGSHSERNDVFLMINNMDPLAHQSLNSLVFYTNTPSMNRIRKGGRSLSGLTPHPFKDHNFTNWSTLEYQCFPDGKLFIKIDGVNPVLEEKEFLTITDCSLKHLYIILHLGQVSNYEPRAVSLPLNEKDNHTSSPSSAATTSSLPGHRMQESDETQQPSSTKKRKQNFSTADNNPTSKSKKIRPNTPTNKKQGLKLIDKLDLNYSPSPLICTITSL
jgi:hypothetical protein